MSLDEALKGLQAALEAELATVASKTTPELAKLAEQIDLEKLAEQIDVSDLAAEIDVSAEDVAAEIDLSDYLDLEESLLDWLKRLARGDTCEESQVAVSQIGSAVTASLEAKVAELEAKVAELSKPQPQPQPQPQPSPVRRLASRAADRLDSLLAGWL